MPPIARPRDEATIDVEEVALLEGLKPCNRTTLLADELEAYERRVGALGLAVKVARDPTRYMETGSEPWVRVYVARTAAAAEAVRAIEQRSLWGPRQGRKTEELALGQALGYPACCARSFVQRATRYARPIRLHALVARLNAHTEGRLPAWLERALAALGESRPGARVRSLELSLIPTGSEDYLVAREAWCAHPDARLNNLLFRQRARLISHVPCAYHCGPSLAYADAVAAAIRARRPAAYERIERLLTSTVVIAPTGARALVERDATGRIVRATSPQETPNPLGMEEPALLDAAFAASCVGRRIAPDGLVDLPGIWPRPVALAFVWHR